MIAETRVKLKMFSASVSNANTVVLLLVSVAE
jgi:hypothetical protein